MKPIVNTVLGVFLLISLLSAQTTLDRIVAIVDKEIITESDLNYSLQSFAIQNRLDPQSPGLREKILDGLINEKLILAQAIEDSIVVTSEEVTDRLDRQVKFLIQQAGSEQRLEEMYNMPISRMKREYRDLIKNQLLVQKVQQAKQASLTVSRRDVEEFFETYKDSLPRIAEEYELSHIYLKPTADSAVVLAVYHKALSVLDSIKAGGDFAEFAKRYSGDPGSASQGGDLGWSRRGLFEKEFEEAAFALKTGEYSKPVRTTYGYHIVQLLERRGESVHTRHILFPIRQSPADDDSTIAQLNRLRQEAKKGENFAVLAKRYSQDPETKDIGGDLGKISVDQMEQAFYDVVKPMKAGDISEPTKVTVGSSYGFHIVWVRSITPAHTMNLTDDYRRLEQLALQNKASEQYQKWLEDLKKTIYWERKL